MKLEEWKTYRTRFLVNAKQLSSTLSFVDHLGRRHSGRKGDYLVESSDGVLSIAPRQIFEDVYVPMTLLDESGSNETISPPAIDRLKFEALEIEEVKFGKFVLARERVDETRAVDHDESVRARRKLPQPFRERRASAQHLRLM